MGARYINLDGVLFRVKFEVNLKCSSSHKSRVTGVCCLGPLSVNVYAIHSTGYNPVVFNHFPGLVKSSHICSEKSIENRVSRGYNYNNLLWQPNAKTFLGYNVFC